MAKIGRKLRNSSSGRKHAWVTVVNPMNQRTLLQACDKCGVVKSENSVVRDCNAKDDLSLISGALSPHQIAI